MNYSDARISPNNFADVMGVSRSTVRSWVDSGKYVLAVMVGIRFSGWMI